MLMYYIVPFSNSTYKYLLSLPRAILMDTNSKTMDFLDPAKNKAHTRRLWIGYILIGIAILLASFILVVLAFGYDVDRKTGEVIQNGLIFADSSPESSTIYLNGKENGQTDKRLTVPEGHYNMELRRKGYTTWKKSFDLQGSSIERMMYPKLFPEKLKAVSAQDFTGSPTLSTQSPDRRWVLLVLPGTYNDFISYDIVNPKDKPVSFELPEGLLSVPDNKDTPQSLKMVEWSTDNKHVLIKHTYGDAAEFVMVDREEPTKSINVNKHLNRTPSTITLRDKKFDRLYLYDAATKALDAANTATKEITPILTGVESYKSYQENIILYAAANETTPDKTDVRYWDDGKIYQLKSFNATSVLLDMARYDGTFYTGVVSVKDGRLYIFADSLEKLKKKPKTEVAPYLLLKQSDPVKLSFSANTRFISVQSGSKFSVYDFEEDRRFSFTAKENVPLEVTASWMDGHRLVFNHNNKVVVYEFDGANPTTLTSIVTGSLPFFDRDYERLWTVAPNAGDPAKTALTRTDLKLNLKL